MSDPDRLTKLIAIVFLVVGVAHKNAGSNNRAGKVVAVKLSDE